jgi:dTDP-4-amino-4,6-dideoxygalactose transaminase
MKLLDKHLILPFVPVWAEPVWHLFVVRNSKRDLLQKELSENGVATMIHYPIPPHMQNAYADLAYSVGSFPISEKIHQEVLSLPIGPHLNPSEVYFIVNIIKDKYRIIFLLNGTNNNILI